MEHGSGGPEVGDGVHQYEYTREYDKRGKKREGEREGESAREKEGRMEGGMQGWKEGKEQGKSAQVSHPSGKNTVAKAGRGLTWARVHGLLPRDMARGVWRCRTRNNGDRQTNRQRERKACQRLWVVVKA